MQLQETGGDRARLYVPAQLRDALNLTDFEDVCIQLICDQGRPTATITPVDSGDEMDGLIRSVIVRSNGQVHFDFPRQVAVAAGFLKTELALNRRGNHLVLAPEE
jgi:bifunctional DNA-binding transcriptional regulator/antitoxin component of YhaV-PrlF toxin-antitoxin module